MDHRIIITITIQKATLEDAVRLKEAVDKLIEKNEEARATLTATPHREPD